jgi:hypothetical protein
MAMATSSFHGKLHDRLAYSIPIALEKVQRCQARTGSETPSVTTYFEKMSYGAGAEALPRSRAGLPRAIPTPCATVSLSCSFFRYKVFSLV